MSGFLSKLFGGGSKTSAAPAGEREIVWNLVDEVHDGQILLLVTDEVRQGLYFFRESLFEAVPETYRNLEKAVRRVYGAESGILDTLLDEPAQVLRFRPAPAVDDEEADTHRLAMLDAAVAEEPSPSTKSAPRRWPCRPAAPCLCPKSPRCDMAPGNPVTSSCG